MSGITPYRTLHDITAFVGLIVLLPLIGHATWHAYQETLDTDAWPVDRLDGS